MNKQEWQAIKQRDPAYDGKFYYAIKNHKTICRPSCTFRNPQPNKVIIFRTLEEGILAGYQPCKRCRPDQSEWNGAKQELTARAIAYMEEHYTEKFSLDILADALYIDRIYLAKSFKEITGTTPLKYHNQLRCDKAVQLLTDPELSIETVGYRVGYVTPSHFARIFKGIYHCTPSEYRRHYYDDLDQ